MTWRLGVVGDPVSHSRSPELHRLGLAHAGLEGTSERIQLNATQGEDLRTLLENSFDALSVTMPLKRVAFEICEWRTPSAERLGVVNSIRTRDGRIEGANTDGEGFVEALRGERGVTPQRRRFRVLGSGGSATAIVDALVEHEAAAIEIVSRNAVTAAALAQRYGNVVTVGTTDAPIDVVVNTIPVTTRGDDGIAQGVTSATVAVDITYEPAMTAWRLAHDNYGCKTMNGLAMLTYQAALQMRWWWGSALDGHTLLESLA